MASPVDVVIAVDSMTADQVRVTSLFSDTLASDESTVTEKSTLMHTSSAQHEHDDQLTTTMTVVNTLQDVPTSRHKFNDQFK